MAATAGGTRYKSPCNPDKLQSDSALSACIGSDAAGQSRTRPGHYTIDIMIRSRYLFTQTGL